VRVNAPAKVHVVSIIVVVSPDPATVPVAFALARVHDGFQAVSVSIRTVTLSTGAPVFFSPSLIVVEETPLPIIFIDRAVLAVTSHIARGAYLKVCDCVTSDTAIL